MTIIVIMENLKIKDRGTNHIRSKFVGTILIDFDTGLKLNLK